MGPTSDHTTLGIVAGRGRLPLDVARAAVAAGRPVFIVGIKGVSSQGIEEFNHAWVRSGAVGSTLNHLKQNNCRDLVLIGPMDRPTLFTFLPDLGALRLGWRIVKLLRQGDDGLLSGVVRYFEVEHGFHIVPAEEIAPGLTAPAGVITQKIPTDADRVDIAIAIEVVRKRGAQDLGQGAVCAAGEVLDVEDEAGTDAMLARVAEDRNHAAPCGVLVKLPKPGQERRVDLPTLGLQTVENVSAAGLAGIAYEASGALLANFDAVIKQANEKGLFIIGLPEGTGEGRIS